MAPMIKPMPACADLSTKSILNKKKFPRFVPEMFSDPVPKDKSKFLLSVPGHKIKKERENMEYRNLPNDEKKLQP